MYRLERTANNFLERFFHLPTFIILALIAVALTWRLYDIGFAVGAGYLRVHSNRGNLNLIWLDGCCELDW